MPSRGPHAQRAVSRQPKVYACPMVSTAIEQIENITPASQDRAGEERELMSWTFAGYGKDVILGITGSGRWIARGAGMHECHPSGGDMGLLGHVEGALCFWSAHPQEESDLYSDPDGKGFKKFHATRTNSVTGMITFVPPQKENRAVVKASLLVPEVASNDFFELCRTLVAHPDLSYLLDFEFHGLSIVEVNNQVATVAEFTHVESSKRRPIFSPRVEFQIEHRPEGEQV